MNSPAALPSQILTWAQAFAPRPVIEVTPIGEGITDTKRLLVLADGEPLVVRWADAQTWGVTGREHVRREALALRPLATSTVPVPQLLASDLGDTNTNGSANLMTWLPGRVRYDHLGPEAVTDLARLTVTVHRQLAHLCADFAMLHAPADAETFRDRYLQQGGHLDPNPDAARFWVISDILGFLPDPAHILVAVSSVVDHATLVQYVDSPSL